MSTLPLVAYPTRALLLPNDFFALTLESGLRLLGAVYAALIHEFFTLLSLA